MSLIKRRPKAEKPIEVEEDEILTSVEDIASHMREQIRVMVQCGMSTHTAQDVQAELLKILDELELTAKPRKKE